MTESTNIDNYKAASLALRDKNLRQALYDEGSIIMKDVLVNLHGEQHKSRRMLETKVFAEISSNTMSLKSFLKLCGKH